MSIREEVTDYIPALRAYAWSLTRRNEDADDLVQDTLAKAIGKIDTFQPGTNLRAWLFTIMRNTFLNEIAKSRRMVTGMQDCVSGSVSTPATQEWTVRGNELMRAVSRLPAHYREMLVMVVMLGESYESAAEIFGVRLGTVKSRVNRARLMVIEDLEGRAPNAPADVAFQPSERGTPGRSGV